MTEILAEIKSLKSLLLKQQSPYADTKEAMTILGVKNCRVLSWLSHPDQGHLKRYPRAGRYVYKKSELLACAESIDNKVIVLPKHK